jgi:parallel beta-helix repeat protein
LRSKRFQLRLPAVAAVLGTAALVAVAPAAAKPHHPHHHHHHGKPHHHGPRPVYVSPSGSAANSGKSCRKAKFDSIQAAIEAAHVKGTVVVCKGTYPGGVNLDKRVILAGKPGATIDANGMAYGVGVSASGATVVGLTVENANQPDSIADGIVTVGFDSNGAPTGAANHVKILGNVVTGNIGSGIDLNSTSGSVAFGNKANGNGVGINVADDLGIAAKHNRVSHNVANKNFGGCGIALADHSGAGVVDNVVDHNVANDNGLRSSSRPDASAGSGVILASPIPGGVVTGNLITHNRFAGNGHAGVVVHAHVPGSDFSGNVISGNVIGTNNLRTDENDLQTTGIYLGSASPMTITVSGNQIHDDYYGIFTSGPVTLTGKHNHFHHVTQKFGTFPTF